MTTCALVSDEWHPINAFIKAYIEKKNYACHYYGAYQDQQEHPWVAATYAAATALTQGLATEGIFSCWSGTGACMVANKVKGLRAALCHTPEDAQLARVWNHANVLVLANRSLTEALACQILDSWFAPYDKTIGEEGVQALTALEA